MKYDMHDYDRSRTGNHLLMGLMAGAAVGGGLALLFAPRQGAEMRHELATGAQRAGKRLREGYESMSESVRQRARHLADEAHHMHERANEESEPVRESVDAATARRMPNGMGTPRQTVD